MRALISFFVFAATTQANGIVLERTTPRGGNQPAVLLREHRVTATVKDRIARVVVEQTFRNELGRPVEGTYIFPLPRDATVGEFEMTVGDRTMEGEVIDADRARAIYRSIVRTRKDPGLLEYVGRGLFRARAFPIGAGQTISVRLTYRQVLPERNGTIELRYPLGTESLNRAPVRNILVDVSFESTIDLKSVYSPSHRVSVTRPDARHGRAVFEASHRREARELVLYFGRSPKDVGFSMLATKPADRDGSFLAVLAPSIALRADEVAPKDVIYVLDTSGSMGIDKLEQARRAIKGGLSLLREHDRFNVVEFSTETRPLHAGLVNATKEARDAAVTWLDKRFAGGGTALADAVLDAMRQADPERLTLVVLLTDGHPTIGERDGDKIVERAKRVFKHKRARVFTFGVGNDLDVRLLDRLAEVTGGEREYVAEHEAIDAVVGAFFRLVDRPVLTDLTLEAEGLTQMYPRRLPDLFAGGQIVILGRYAESGVKTFRLRGKRGNKAVEYVFEARADSDNRNAYLERMWSQRKVAYLLDEIRLHGENKELVDEVRALGIRYAIITPWTAGLVVEPELRRRISSSSPLFFNSGGRRRPNVGTPPGLREPGDPEAPPPPSDPGGGVRGPPAPSTPPTSRIFKKAMQSHRLAPEEFIKLAGGRTFKWTTKQRWIDAAWDGKGAVTQVEAYSDAYFELVEKDDRIAQYLALGDHVLFLYGGVIYEVVPARDAEEH